MKKNKKKVIMERLVPLKKAGRDFDLKFWKKIGTYGKFEAAWQMVCDLPNWNPRYGTQQRLRRSVASLKLRPR